MIEASLILIAALGRVAVGMGLASRWYVYPPVALGIAYFTLGISIWTPIIAAVAALNVGLGHTKWGDRLHQSIRYAFLPAILAGAYFYFEHDGILILWAGLCGIVGWAEPAVRKQLEPFGFTIFGREISSAQYAEFLIGAVCLGGFAMVSFLKS